MFLFPAEIMTAQNFNLAAEWSHNGVYVGPNLAFFEKKFKTG